MKTRGRLLCSVDDLKALLVKLLRHKAWLKMLLVLQLKTGRRSTLSEASLKAPLVRSLRRKA